MYVQRAYVLITSRSRAVNWIKTTAAYLAALEFSIVLPPPPPVARKHEMNVTRTYTHTQHRQHTLKMFITHMHAYTPSTHKRHTHKTHK